MFDWLFEGRVSVYVLLGVAAALLLYAGRARRQKSLLLAGGIVACLIGLYYLLDRFVEQRFQLVGAPAQLGVI